MVLEVSNPRLIPRMSHKKHTAAALVARGELTHEQIAAKMRITSRTLSNWKNDPVFAANVREHVEAWRQKVLEAGIADRVNRVFALNDRAERMRRLIEARAAEYGDAPGGDTGLLVRTYRSVKRGREYDVVEEYSFDAALAREMREHEKQAAQELGQWAERVETSGTLEQRHLVIDLTKLTDEELDTLAKLGITPS